MSNNFNLIRLFAALAVIWSHSYPLALGPNNFDSLHWFFGFEFGRVCVDVFFVVSGYLITKSAIRSQSSIQFLMNRLLRIYPGLWVCLLVTCIVYYLSAPWGAGVNPIHEIASYLGFNGTLIRGSVDFSMDGAFISNPTKGLINGSLWTLPWEIRMYALVATIYFVFPGARRFLLSALLLVALALEFIKINELFDLSPVAFVFSRFAITFFVGAFFAEFIPSWRPHAYLVAGLLACVVLLALTGISLPYFAYIVGLPIVVLGLALSVPSPAVLQSLAATDVSYGVYLYGCPIQQLLVYFMPSVSPWVMTLIAVPLALMTGWLSYKFVEAPALSLKPWLMTRIQSLSLPGGQA
jgi:peptidoglycan/LPS O-acetylase OafA/YrhL